jgi:hypothetical protein
VHFGSELRTCEIRKPLVVPKDSVNGDALKESAFFVSEWSTHCDSRNHFIEFDRTSDALYFVAHIFPKLGMRTMTNGSGSMER